jgi:hypothetical protein
METVNAAKEPNHLIGNFLNNVLTDLKNLTNALKALSKPASDVPPSPPRSTTPS